MNRVLSISIVVFLALRLPAAETNGPVRLAVVPTTSEAATASDLLTAELSKKGNVQLLEREQIDKVYREQGLSAANRDYVKLGQILGADGLLLLEITGSGTNQFLEIRTVAVKPGVVLSAERFSWPLKDASAWASSFATHQEPLLPKLTVLAKEAVPISVVNFRSAIQSGEEQDVERQLKLLTIERLSREQRFFVLERQKMDLLGEEKELKADESAFWDGSYLLDATVDQNGYDKDVVTIDGRLTPAKGGTPLTFQVKGERAKLADVVNAAAVKVDELLKVSPTVTEWNAADEAEQYYKEAQWALRWGLLSEAQEASESAWALGKQDLECDLVRIKSYVSEVSAHATRYGESEATYDTGADAEADVEADIKNAQAEHPWGLAYQRTTIENSKSVGYIFADRAPDPENIDRALHALGLYQQFSKGSPAALARTNDDGSNQTSSHGTPWYELGIDVLKAASEVLQSFAFCPSAQGPVADKLAELRAQARSVATSISAVPSVRDSYFVGDRLATQDELAGAAGHEIFRMEAEWGCFWQEHPQDTIAAYRGLMGTPVFCYIHKGFLVRPLQAPRLVGWNEEDRKQIPSVWGDFMRELDGSTNLYWNLEAKALRLVDAKTPGDTGEAFTNFFTALFADRDAMVTNPVEVVYDDWGADRLVEAMGRAGTFSGVSGEAVNAMRHRFYTDYWPRLRTMEDEYWRKTVPARKVVTVFSQQTEYLRTNKPYEFFEFVHLFEERNYSREQALEISPLLAAYKSNLMAQAEEAPAQKKGQLQSAVFFVKSVEQHVDEILHPSTNNPPAPTMTIVAPRSSGPSVRTNLSETATNILTVNRFVALPWMQLLHLDSSTHVGYSKALITAHGWSEDKLVLDFSYHLSVEYHDQRGNFVGGDNLEGDGVAVFDPVSGRWDVAGCPETSLERQSSFYHRSVVVNGRLFDSDGGQIRRYDFDTGRWIALAISDGSNYELFSVNGRLYAANQNVIFEVSDDGKSSRLLASNRRQPPASALDTDPLGSPYDHINGPVVFAGPDKSLRVGTRDKIFTEVGDAWRDDGPVPPSTFPTEIFRDGVLFRSETGIGGSVLNRMESTGKIPELCFLEKRRSPNDDLPNFRRPDGPKDPESLWRLPQGLHLVNLPAGLCASNLYLFVDHSKIQDVARNDVIVRNEVEPMDGYHAQLLCYSPGCPAPQKIFLRFDDPKGCPPVTGRDPTASKMFPWMPPVWMSGFQNFLILGLERSRDVPATQNLGDGYQTGIWLVPISELEAIAGPQRQAWLDRKTADVVAADQAKKGVLAKYDLDHNGVIDLTEREEALGDPAFVGSEIDAIDVDHDGLLEPNELSYFDANRNSVLDPNERAGIETAESLLAKRLLQKFDADGDNALDPSEFRTLWQSLPTPNGSPPFGYAANPFPDADKNGTIDPDELKLFLDHRLAGLLRPVSSRGGRPFSPGIAAPVQMPSRISGNDQPLAKAWIESYWKNANSGTNR